MVVFLCEELERRFRERVVRLFGVEMFVEYWIGFFIGVALLIVGLLIILRSSLEVVGVGTVVSVLGTLLPLFTFLRVFRSEIYCLCGVTYLGG
ncbi:MAG: hypothetical protein DRJ40_11605 [Thermoprotei archaeon]|nr:MAG: hypothetical protein DRJ40_11605 [Thermoprotei archaeon]